jgi:hypothetical protein
LYPGAKDRFVNAISPRSSRRSCCITGSDAAADDLITAGRANRAASE